MQTVLRTEPPAHDVDHPRDIVVDLSGSDRAFVLTTRSIAATVLVITGGIGLFLAYSAVPTMNRYGLDFLTGTRWEPESDVLGIGSVLVGTLTVALVALVVAFPLSLMAALYIAEYAPPRLRGFLTSLVDLMAAVPSIVYGLWGFFLLQPHASKVAHWIHQHLGFIPFFRVDTDADAAVWDQSKYTASAFIAGLAVAMMVIPMACAVMRQVFGQTPAGEREAAFALGATHWGVVRTVVLPFGRGGIIGGTMLGLGRALGETIAVLLIISPSFDLKLKPLEIGTNTVSALIAGRFGEASETQLAALLAAGFVLFMITLLINTLAAVVVNRSRSGAGAEA
ncbi:MAG: phosphate ABC transporter permease subunit PstC [Aeromicrobium erythreum]